MTIYDVLFDMSSIPPKSTDETQSPNAARFVDYISRSIEWSASKYIRDYNRAHSHEQLQAFEAENALGSESSYAKEMLERIENMVVVMNEVSQLKRAEQQIYICLYQLDWNVSKTARVMGCSESYVCRLNRNVIRKLGLALKDGE